MEVFKLEPAESAANADCSPEGVRKDRRVATMTRLQSLLDQVPSTTDRFGKSYWRWESFAAGMIECIHGYTKWYWWTSDGDSFGPLVRSVEATNPQTGKREVASYG